MSLGFIQRDERRTVTPSDVVVPSDPTLQRKFGCTRAIIEVIAALVGFIGLRIEHSHPHKPDEQILWLTQYQVNVSSSLLLIDAFALYVILKCDVTKISVLGLGASCGLAFIVIPFAEHLPFAEMVTFAVLNALSLIMYVLDYIACM